jgi:hypothetical protein
MVRGHHHRGLNTLRSLQKPAGIGPQGERRLITSFSPFQQLTSGVNWTCPPQGC